MEEKKISNKDENKKDNIVPAYAKKNVEAGKNQNDKKYKSNVKNKIIFIGIVVAVVLLAVLTIYIINVFRFSKYNQYSEKMDKYGLSQLYNNGKSTSHQYVTKSEALKIIISAIENINDFSFVVHTEEYKNQDWVEYAIENDIITSNDIDKSNASKKVIYIELIKYFSNARKKLLDAELNTSVYPNYSDTVLLKPQELYAVSDLIYNGVLENSSSKLNPNRKLRKGEVNKFIIEAIEKFNLMIPEGKKLNINPEKIPENEDEYSFTLYDVEKDVYEKPYIVNDEEEFELPKNVYAEYRDAYSSIEANVENYFKTILNIDYNTIEVQNFFDTVEKYALFQPELEYIREYVDYVKKNKIIISGKAEAQSPIIYYDGEDYRVRTKIKFDIKQSDTKENLLYLDLIDMENIVTYEAQSYEFYVDVKVDTPGIKNMYVWENSIVQMLNGEQIENIVLTEKQYENDVFKDEE